VEITPEQTATDRSPRLAKCLGWTALALAIVAAILFGLAYGKVSLAKRSERQALLALTPRQDKTNGYTSSASCRACHPSQYASWHKSYHRTMTQLASTNSVMGRFDGTEIESGGLHYRVFQTNGQYWATMPDPEIIMKAVMGGRRIDDHTYLIKTNGVLKHLDLTEVQRVDKRVVMTTGSHHYQTYWVEGSVRNPQTQTNETKYGNVLQTLPLVYLPKEQQWIPRDNAFMTAPDSKRMISQWNHHCIKCHSTAGNPGLVDSDGTFDTRVAELGISCEACHGPSAEHAEHYRSPLARYAEQFRDTPAAKVVNPAKLDHKRSSQICGQCHGVYIYNNEKLGRHFAHNGPKYRPGDDINSIRYYIQHPGPAPTPVRQEDLEKNKRFFRERWWDDGTILAGGREFTAMRVSACYTKGTLSCVNCHSMHDSNPVDQLKPDMRGNTACIECHTESEYTTEIGQHTFHKPDSTGSNCLNCHMPHTTYALLGAIRNHQIQSPTAKRSIRHGTPNACNLCHLDQTLNWTQQQLAKRYGHESLPLSAEQKNTSAALLWLLKGHAAQRAIAAWHAGWQPAIDASGDGWLAPHLARLLEDPYGVVRHIANESLKKQPGFGAFEFDFIAPEAERARLAKRAITQWNDLPGNDTDATGDAILIDPDRQLMETAIQALLKNRDNRPVSIKE
jgi:predicted CXXCH cytochrome family protein